MKQSKYLKRAKDFSYDICPADKSTKEEVSVLVSDLYDHAEAELDFLNWSVWENSFGKSIAYLARDKFTKKVVGFLSLIPFPKELNDKTVTVWICAKPYIDIRHLKKGVYQKLVNSCSEVLESSGSSAWIVHIGNGKSAHLNKNIGFERSLDLKKLVRPRFLSVFIGSKKDSRDSVKLSTLEAATAGGFKLMRPKKANRESFGTWFSNDPANKHLILQLKDDQNSYMILCVKGTSLCVEEVSVRSNEAGKKMVSFLDSEVKKKGLSGIYSHVVSNSESALLLKSIGFLHNPFTIGPWNETVSAQIKAINRPENTPHSFVLDDLAYRFYIPETILV